MRIRGLAFGVVFAACGGGREVARRDETRVARRAEPARDAGPPPPGAVGDACTRDESPRGTCGEELQCLPGPGGQCGALVFGEERCPEGSVRVESPRGGEACVKPCTADADCRSDQGYACDAVWHACALPGSLAPHAPECAAAPALPRRVFSGAQQLTTPSGPGRYDFEVSATRAGPGLVIGAHIAGTQRPAPNPLGTFAIQDGRVRLAEHPLTSERTNHFDPWLATDRSGVVHAVWLEFDGGTAPERRARIGYAQTRDGETWTTPIAVHDPLDCPDEMPGCMDKPVLAIGPDPTDPRRDNLYLAYFTEAREGERVRRSSDGGAHWEPSVPIGNGSYGDIWVSTRGVVHVVWTDQPADAPAEGPRPALLGDPRFGVFHTHSDDGARTWSTPVRVSEAEESVPLFFSNAQVVADDARGKVFVAYPAGTPDGSWDLRLAVSSDGGATWRRSRVNDDPHCANHMTPSMALDPATGRVHLVWTENRGGAGGVAYTSCDATGRCAPNEAVSDRPFASYTFVRHGIAWLGEYGALVLDPDRRALTAVWTQTVMESDVSTSRIFFATGDLRRAARR